MSDIDFMYDFKYVIGTLAQALTIRRRCRRRPLSVVAPGAPALLDGTWPAETPDDAQPLLRRRCGSRLPEPPGSRRVTPLVFGGAREQKKHSGPGPGIHRHAHPRRWSCGHLG